MENGEMNSTGQEGNRLDLDKRSNYFDNNDAFNKRFSRFSTMMPSIIQELIFVGHSKDWFELAYEKARVNNSFDDIEDPISDLDELYVSKDYEHLTNKEKAYLLFEIIKEMQRLIIRFRDMLSESDRKLLNYKPEINYFRPDYSKESQNPFLYPNPKSIKSSKNQVDYEGQDEYVELGTYEFIIKQSINELAKISSDNSSIDFLLNFWEVSKDPYFGPAIARTISEINPQEGVEKILSELGQASEEDQTRLLSLLYRLEIGQVGIDEKGVNYLGRLFDIGIADGFASRLTADGRVGVFDRFKKLIGLFKLESDDFSEEHTEAIKKSLQEITIDMLFIPRPDETDSDKAQKIELLFETLRSSGK